MLSHKSQQVRITVPADAGVDKPFRQAWMLLLKVTEYPASDFYKIIKLTSNPW